MKPTAFLEYTFLFTPDSNTWTNLFQFEADLAKFFQAKGLDARILKTVEGGVSGKRILQIAVAQTVSQNMPQPKESKPASEQIKQVQTQQPTKSFKQYQERGVPKSFVNQDKRAPQLQFNNSGRANRQKVRIP